MVSNILSKERSIAPKEFNRWLIPASVLGLHLSIGQIYAYSAIKPTIMEVFDASRTAAGAVFSIAIFMLGMSAAVMGSRVEKWGPRKSMFISTLFWVSGFILAAIGVQTNQFWMIYLYGLVGGIGLGIGYISPVNTLIKFFYNNPGVATGIAIMGFGSGALFAAPFSSMLLTNFGPDPKTALFSTLLILGGLYLILMMLSAFTIRIPHPDWRPKNWTDELEQKKQAELSVSSKQAVKTPQFYLLWLVMLASITAGIGMLEQASSMIRDFYPAVAVAAAAGFVGLLSLSNGLGRLGWSSLSDKLGRKRSYMMYLGVGALAYLSLALFGNQHIVIFVILMALVISFYGAGFATLPAYIKDLFGGSHVSSIHGLVLTAWSISAILGVAIVDGLADAGGEVGTQGAALYHTSLIVMACILVVGFISNLLIKPVDAKYAEMIEDEGGSHELDASKENTLTGFTKALPYILWVLVGSAILYGLVETIIKASALFTG